MKNGAGARRFSRGVLASNPSVVRIMLTNFEDLRWKEKRQRIYAEIDDSHG
jgi:hypothetical protein